MREIIISTTSKLKDGSLTLDEANKILLDLFDVSGSLRDKFASEAMQAIIIKNGVPSDYHWGNGIKDGKPDLAKKSYEIADAMLKARNADQ